MAENMLHSAIRFGREEHMIDLFNNGTIYMNTLEYFRKVEETDINRADSYEGVSLTTDIKWMSITIPETEQQIQMSIDGSTDVTLKNPVLRQEIKGNAYCMYGITTEWMTTCCRIDPRNADFGDGMPAMVVIHDISTFLVRVKAAIKRLDYFWMHGAVTYGSEIAHKQSLDVFWKPERFRYQWEFRIFVPRKTDEALVFQIGSIADIAEIYKADNLAELQIKCDDVYYRKNS